MTGGPAVGVDVGGTKILSGLIDDDGAVQAVDKRSTPTDGDEVVSEIVAAVTALCPDGDCSALPVGVGYPGLVTLGGYVHYGPNIGLSEYPLREQLVTRLGTDAVVVGNDASAATWAEFRIGSGADVEHTMAMFTLGTGVGGGLVIGGVLHRGFSGFAGELGHMVIEIDGVGGRSGIDGTTEAYASGTAMERMAAAVHADGGFLGTELDGDCAPSGEQVTAAAKNGVDAAIAILSEMGRYLGIAAAGIVNAIDPEVIVVGGGAAAAGELLLEPARAALTQHVLGPSHRPDVGLVAATLGDRAGMVGAGLLALDRR